MQKTITLTFWACLNEKHRHISKTNAQRCIDQQERTRLRGPSWASPEGKQILRDMLADRESGMTFKDIGLKHSISAQTAGQKVHKAERLFRI